MNVRKTDSGKWAYDFWFDGKRYIRVVDNSKEQAEGAMAVHRKRLLDRKHGLASPITDIPFADLAEKYYKLEASTKRSWSRARLSLDHLKRAFKGRLVSEITELRIDEYKDKRFEKVDGPTINRELGTLSHVFTKAIGWGHAATNPVRGIKRYAENDPVNRPLTREEEPRLLAAASKRLRAIILIALNTGMRRNEILSLRWKNINLPEGQIELEARNTKGGKKKRLIPLNTVAVDALRTIPHAHDLLFYSPRTKTHVRDVKTAFHAACEKAEIHGLRFHDLRHTFGTRLVEQGVDIVTVQKLMGHSRIEMTMRYAHSSEDNQRRAVAKLTENGAISERIPERPSPAPEQKPCATYSYMYN